jgi:excisionase family DNA binding protein
MSIQQRFKKNLEPIAPEMRLLSPKQAAVYIGMSIDVIRDLIKDRRISYVRNGRLYLIDRRDLDAWIERRKIKAVA